MRTPISAGCFLLGFFALTGAPPFGPFFSELSIAEAAFSGHTPLLGAAFLGLLLLAFVGMAITVLQVVQGDPPEQPPSTFRETLWTTVPVAAFLVVALVLGLWLPPPLANAMQEARILLEAR
jgi:hydrogenase-4 component F